MELIGKKSYRKVMDMNVWKIGSRWGKYQLLKKFVDNHIVFVGT